uniref:Unannotated protein n=1 Tax=freshwater metagenome TaxID=449393 RepID=A0A6J6A201_9ZZZZ
MGGLDVGLHLIELCLLCVVGSLRFVELRLHVVERTLSARERAILGIELLLQLLGVCALRACSKRQHDRAASKQQESVPCMHGLDCRSGLLGGRVVPCSAISRADGARPSLADLRRASNRCGRLRK